MITHNPETFHPGVLPAVLNSDDADILIEFYSLFRDQTARFLADLLEAQSRADIDTVATLAHKTRSSASTAGAVALPPALHSLEIACKARTRRSINAQIGRVTILSKELLACIEHEILRLKRELRT